MAEPWGIQSLFLFLLELDLCTSAPIFRLGEAKFLFLPLPRALVFLFDIAVLLYAPAELSLHQRAPMFGVLVFVSWMSVHNTVLQQLSDTIPASFHAFFQNIGG